ncbi:MAG TPA: TlpA disulfide reductase family protein [Acetobacteraceae bacterium]|nr:TlpA disulfide reductase family protein [Acetobacteraceae bacterium]
MSGKLGRLAVIGVAATLLAAIPPRKLAADESVDLHSPDTAIAVSPPVALPDLALTKLDGGKTSLKAYLGHPVVLNFWATWCVPCVAELPELDKLAAQGVTVLAVSADHTGAAAVKPFLAKHPLTHVTVLLDPGSDAVHQAQVVGFPTTLILDAAGRVRGRLEGPATWSTGAAVVKRLAG